MKINTTLSALLFTLLTGGLFPASAGDKPNIVLILADDMGPGEASYAGSIIPTPAIDRLAIEGANFTDGHTSSAVCTPTRYGILTGRYNWRSRLKKSVIFNTTSPALMDPDRVNLPAFLRSEGYHTGMVGKWHLGVDWVLFDHKGEKYKKLLEEKRKEASRPKEKFFNSWMIDYTKPFKNGPVDVGFDSAFFVLASLDMPPYLYLEGNKATELPTTIKGWQHNEYNDHIRYGAASEGFEASEALETLAAKSREYIKEQAENTEKPFFLYLALTSPHTPVTPGKKFKGRYSQFSHYADFIAETDWVVEQVLEELKESNVDENTLVIFTADNGFAAYIPLPNMMKAGYAPSGPYRGAKTALYEGGHRVPFLMRWPKGIQPGLKINQTVCTTDFYATFADIIGKKSSISVNAAEDSFSFLPALKGSSEPVRPFTIHHAGNGDFAIRQGDWKLLLTKKTGTGAFPRKTRTTAQKVQLYNLKDDRAETKNLENAHPERIQSMVETFNQALRRGRTTPGPELKNDGWPIIDKNLMTTFPQLKE
ncbi:arylsulfatase [Verrucomicrobiaceae bacterium N1E253]|uniref:Arylsulfatase n=1 Tax=Oceaniferula marina TaxID=2748318 RepID=A0A851GC87_9BACT|nr:arylsulfatase [Oceaniferula marina]NWK54542.1 arylsulfatase [Oceaniferula marina]